MKKLIIILFMVMLLPGCGKKEEQTLEMNCNNTVTTLSVKAQDKVSCRLLDEEYIFTIDNIENNMMEISTLKYGLDSKNSLKSKEKSWTIRKGESLKLHTQSTDYQENVIFNWQ